MTAAQENHLSHINQTFGRRVTEKYRKGVEEHGGNLWAHLEMDLIEDAISEAVDLFTYLITLRDKLGTLEATSRILGAQVNKYQAALGRIAALRSIPEAHTAANTAVDIAETTLRVE